MMEILLTAAQKDKVEWCFDKVTKVSYAVRCPASTSLGEGLYRTKEKGVDPFNWGNTNLDEDDLDLVTQLNSMKQNLNKKLGKTTWDIFQLPILCRDQAAHPVQQVPPASYFGQTLRHIDYSGKPQYVAGHIYVPTNMLLSHIVTHKLLYYYNWSFMGYDIWHQLFTRIVVQISKWPMTGKKNCSHHKVNPKIMDHTESGYLFFGGGALQIYQLSKIVQI